MQVPDADAEQATAVTAERDPVITPRETRV